MNEDGVLIKYAWCLECTGGKTRGEGKGQIIESWGVCIHVEEFLLGDRQPGAICCLCTSGSSLQPPLASLPPEPLTAMAASSQGWLILGYVHTSSMFQDFTGSDWLT